MTSDDKHLWICAGVTLVVLTLQSRCSPHSTPALPPEPSYVIVGDAQVPLTCAAACANRMTLGCATEAATCAKVCQHAVDTHLTPVPLTCMVNATTKSEAVACGFFTCQ